MIGVIGFIRSVGVMPFFLCTGRQSVAHVLVRILVCVHIQYHMIAYVQGPSALAWLGLRWVINLGNNELVSNS